MSLIGHVYLPRSLKEGKKPKASELNYGELAINYNADHEFLSVKNSSGNVVTFSSDTSKNKPYYTKAETSGKTEIQSALDKKQDKLTIDTALSETSGNLVQNSAITKVILENEKTISASLNDLNDRKLDASTYTKYDDSTIKTDISALQTSINGKQDKGNYVSATTLTNSYYTKTETSGSSQISTALTAKQDKLTAGTGIGISNNIISVTLDTTIFTVVTALPTSNISNNKIYLVPTTGETDTDDIYTEYLYANSKWERIGALNKKIDLTPYYKKSETSGATEIQTALDKKQNKLTIDTALSETSGNLVQNSAITKVILDDEKTISAALNDLNDRKLDASAYTKSHDDLVDNVLVWKKGTGESAVKLDSGATASGKLSVAEGKETSAQGVNSHAEGKHTTASGLFSHAEGYSTTASGDCSHAEGDSTTASGVNSHAEGSNTTASGDSSHAEGNYTTASGLFSHAEGDSTTASGVNSHAEGNHTTASGVNSHAEGNHTIAMNKCEHACGSYNRSVSGSGQLFSVGAGTSYNKRVNSFYVKNDGTIGSDLDMSISGNTKITLSTASDRLIMSGGTITTNCTMTTGAHFTTSDERLKTNIIGITEDEIEKAKKVNLKSFELKRDGKKHFGVVAQEVETAGLAELVNTDSEGMKSVDYTSLLILKIAELEKEIKDLKNQISKK